MINNVREHFEQCLYSMNVDDGFFEQYSEIFWKVIFIIENFTLISIQHLPLKIIYHTLLLSTGVKATSFKG